MQIASAWKMDDFKKETLQQFGTILHNIREEKGLTLLDLEVATGISEGNISKIENGKKNPAFTTLVKLAKGLGLSVSQLLERFQH